MSKQNIMRLCRVFIISCMVLDVCGCATMSLWEKKRTARTQTMKSRRADLKDIFTLEAGDGGRDRIRLCLLFNARPSIIPSKTFPPFQKGALVLLPGPGTKRLVTRINRLNAALNPDESLSLSKVTVYRVISETGRISNELSMEVIRKYGGGGMGIYQLGTTLHGRPKKFNMKFDNALEIDNENPVPVNIDISSAKLSFLECSRSISAYKNPSAVSRIFSTPFAVAFDVATLPFQLVLFFTIPLWMPA